MYEAAPRGCLKKSLKKQAQGFNKIYFKMAIVGGIFPSKYELTYGFPPPDVYINERLIFSRNRAGVGTARHGRSHHVFELLCGGPAACLVLLLQAQHGRLREWLAFYALLESTESFARCNLGCILDCSRSSDKNNLVRALWKYW